MRKIYMGLSVLCVSGLNTVALAEDQSSSKGFIEDSTLNFVARNLYFNRDVKDGGKDPRGWGQSFRLDYQSGFTQGTLGFGLDASGTAVFKLDGGPGHPGSGLFPMNGNDPRDESTSAGAVAKVRLSKTTLKYGDLRPYNPVFAMPDSRLVPMTTRGWQLLSQEIDGLTLDAGHFTSSKGYLKTGHDGGFRAGYAGSTGGNVDYLGATYQYNKNLQFSAYTSRVEDLWRQYYVNAKYAWPLSLKESLKFDFNLYRSLDDGAARAGVINVTAWSLATAYTYDTHMVTLAFQNINGDQPFDYLKTSDGGYTDGIYLANSSQYGDFNGPNEKSWRLGYDYDMRGLGIPGLTLGGRYVYGYNIDGKHLDPNGPYGYFADASTQTEKDVRAKYVVQSGQLKDLSVQVRYAAHRFSGDGLPNLNEWRLITEYPINIF